MKQSTVAAPALSPLNGKPVMLNFDGAEMRCMRWPHPINLRSSALLSVPIHSAHVGQVYRVHYRWHAYFGADVKVFRTLNRGDGQHVGLERDPGIAILAPAWILDASVCQSFELGEPVVSTEALFELHSVLQHLGFRRGFTGDDSPMEAPNDASQIPDTNPIATAVGTGTIADGTRIPGDLDCAGASAPDRGKIRSGRVPR